MRVTTGGGLIHKAMGLLRGIVYRLGFRPRSGTVLYSPSRDIISYFRDHPIGSDWPKDSTP